MLDDDTHGKDALREAIIAACRTVFDPEVPVNIYDLGLIYTIDVDEDGQVDVEMSLTSPACPVAGEMPVWVGEAIDSVDGARARSIELVWEPQWGLQHMSDEARLTLGLL
jgi:FeS assembly SUF system protein